MSTPLVSVVIPTIGRPAYLPQAVASALNGMPHGDVEVIVVPNGADTSWRQSLERWRNDPAVRVLPIVVKHGCAARNHGMRNARGRYLRFLDDDDFLYNNCAATQYSSLEHSQADVCSGGLDVVNDDLSLIETRHAPSTEDFTAATLHAMRLAQPAAHVFRRTAVTTVQWDESRSYTQDIDWMLRVCASRDLQWVRTDQIVGAWRLHSGQRISTYASQPGKRKLVTIGILALLDRLEAEARLTEERRRTAATALWSAVNADLARSPWFWSSVARRALWLDPDSHPDIPLYQHPLMQYWRPSPLLWEWLMLPKRLITRRLPRDEGAT